MSTLKHPYEAWSTHELEKKVLRHKTPSISNAYSSELNFIIKKCLIKNPLDRPSAIDLLNHTIIIRKMSKYQFNFEVKEVKNTQSMIDTILVPKKLSNLNKKLPNKWSNSLGVFKSEEKKD